MKNLIRAYNDFSLWEVKERNELHLLDQFVLKVYYYHHLKQNYYPQNELSVMIQEDIDSLTHSSFFVAYDNSRQIIGTIKLQKWDGENELSIEKDFKVDLKEIFIRFIVYVIIQYSISPTKLNNHLDIEFSFETIFTFMEYSYIVRPSNFSRQCLEFFIIPIL